jgi:hypothetical protein
MISCGEGSPFVGGLLGRDCCTSNKPIGTRRLTQGARCAPNWM